MDKSLKSLIRLLLVGLLLGSSLTAQILFPIVGGKGGTGITGAGSTFTFVTYTFVAENSAAVSSVTSPALTLTAGDFVVWFCRASTSSTVTVSSTPANTVATFSQVTWPTSHPAIFAYILNASAGSTTVTCSFSTAATFSSMVVLQYHHSGSAASLDMQDVGSHVSGLVTSNPFNTTGTPGLVIQCATWAAPVVAAAGTIGGVTATVRGVSNASLSTTADAACQDVTFAGTQTGITAVIGTASTGNSGYSVGAFK